MNISMLFLGFCDDIAHILDDCKWKFAMLSIVLCHNFPHICSLSWSLWCCRDIWQLDDHYDLEHRSHAILEEGQVIQIISDLLIFLFHRSFYIAMTIELVFLQMLNALKIRYHSAKSSDMPYNEKYTPFFEEFGLLPFIRWPGRRPIWTRPQSPLLWTVRGRRRTVSTSR